LLTRALPLGLPSVYVSLPGESTPADVDTGGYDVMIGGYGFRLATDQQFYYSRSTEPITTHRYDSSLEPGEQSLSPLPWIKAQSSFHGGAGQLNLEQGFNAFQYQQEQVSHVRFDTCQGVDVWTPGKVQRLPGTKLTPALSSGDFAHMVTAAPNGVDVAIAGGVHTLTQITWGSGPSAAPTQTAIDLSGANFGGATNCTVSSLVTNGNSYFALIQLAAPTAALPGVRTLVVKGAMDSTATPAVIYKSKNDSTPYLGALGWRKARLLGGFGRALYELDSSPVTPPVDISTLTAKYTHPSTAWLYTGFAESPTAILASGQVGKQSSLLAFELDTSGVVPTLAGGATVAELPNGEVITSMESVVGSFLAVGTNHGVRIGTYDTYVGRLSLGPLTVSSTQPVLGLAAKDRFLFAGYTNQQADGRTGLVRIDLSYVIDGAGRNAWAPDLCPPMSSPTGHGSVTAVCLLPTSNRLVFVAPDGLHVEQAAPNADDVSWLRTSRIRYATTEMKLFKWGRVTGSLDTATIGVSAITPFSGTFSLGTFGFLTDGNPGEFELPNGLSEWLQMQFQLNGTSCVLSSYQVKAYPAPAAANIIMLTVNCFRDETDRYDLSVSDPATPRQRWQNVLDLKRAGKQVRYVEFTNQGAVAEMVLIDEIEFRSFSRPSTEDDFGGYITLKLRSLEGA
jgi:hypothetical protein